MLSSSFFLILPITRSYSQWNLSLAPENTFLQMTKSLRFEQSFLGTQFGGSTPSLCWILMNFVPQPPLAREQLLSKKKRQLGSF